MNTFQTDLDLSANTVDVRDIIERVEELENTVPPAEESDGDDNEDREELATLVGILDDLKGNGGDEQWRGDWYPTTLIRETYFEDYARELAEDIGAIDKDAAWPDRHIDWEAAAQELLQDYQETDIEGTTYYYR
jgi:hypothetical protein